MTALDEISQAPNLRELLDKLERAWNDEQRRRHEFWADVDEGIKAEFILGEIIYLSFSRIWSSLDGFNQYFN